MKDLDKLYEKINYDMYVKDYKTLSKTDFLKKHKDLTEKAWELTDKLGKRLMQ